MSQARYLEDKVLNSCLLMKRTLTLCQALKKVLPQIHLVMNQRIFKIGIKHKATIIRINTPKKKDPTVLLVRLKIVLNASLNHFPILADADNTLL